MDGLTLQEKITTTFSAVKMVTGLVSVNFEERSYHMEWQGLVHLAPRYADYLFQAEYEVPPDMLDPFQAFLEDMMKKGIVRAFTIQSTSRFPVRISVDGYAGRRYFNEYEEEGYCDATRVSQTRQLRSDAD